MPPAVGAWRNGSRCLLALAAAVMVAVSIGSVTAMRLVRARQATDLTAVWAVLDLNDAELAGFERALQHP